MRHRKAFTRPDRGVVLQRLYRSELLMNPVGRLMFRMVRRCLLWVTSRYLKDAAGAAQELKLYIMMDTSWASYILSLRSSDIFVFFSQTFSNFLKATLPRIQRRLIYFSLHIREPKVLCVIHGSLPLAVDSSNNYPCRLSSSWVWGQPNKNEHTRFYSGWWTDCILRTQT